MKLISKNHEMKYLQGDLKGLWQEELKSRKLGKSNSDAKLIESNQSHFRTIGRNNSNRNIKLEDLFSGNTQNERNINKKGNSQQPRKPKLLPYLPQLQNTNNHKQQITRLRTAGEAVFADENQNHSNIENVQRPLTVRFAAVEGTENLKIRSAAYFNSIILNKSKSR